MFRNAVTVMRAGATEFGGAGVSDVGVSQTRELHPDALRRYPIRADTRDRARLGF